MQPIIRWTAFCRALNAHRLAAISPSGRRAASWKTEETIASDPQIRQPDSAAGGEPRTESPNTDPLSSTAPHEQQQQPSRSKDEAKGGGEQDMKTQGFDPSEEKKRGTSKFA